MEREYGERSVWIFELVVDILDLWCSHLIGLAIGEDYRDFVSGLRLCLIPDQRRKGGK